MGIFYGTYNRALDEKHRLLLPKKLIDDEVTSLYVLRGFEGSIAVYDETGFEKLVKELNSFSYYEEESRHFVRMAAASIEKLQVDAQKRLKLSTELARRYKIGNEVTIIGALDHFELWDKKAYEEYLDSHLGSYDKPVRKGERE